MNSSFIQKIKKKWFFLTKKEIYIPTHIPTKSLATPNKLEQGLSEIESFQEPIGNLPCV